MSTIVKDLPIPHYAVIFSSLRTVGDNGYAATAQRMLELARQQPGFLGYEIARQDGFGISVSYWSSLDAISAWRNHPEHRAIHPRADEWYADSCIRVCKVERSY